MAVKEDLPAIILRPHREVDPIGGAPLLLDKFIEIPFRAIGDVEQDSRHADHLLRPIAVDIHRTARQVIAPPRTPALLIHLLRAEATVDDDRNIVRPITI